MFKEHKFKCKLILDTFHYIQLAEWIICKKFISWIVTASFNKIVWDVCNYFCIDLVTLCNLIGADTCHFGEYLIFCGYFWLFEKFKCCMCVFAECNFRLFKNVIITNTYTCYILERFSEFVCNCLYSFFLHFCKSTVCNCW